MSNTRIIFAGSFIDGTGGDVRKKVVLSVNRGVITSISHIDDLQKNEAAAIDDLSHCTLLPALVDCSCSLSRSAALSQSPGLSAKQGSKELMTRLDLHIQYCHGYGVLGVVDSGDIAEHLLQHSKKSTSTIPIDIKAATALPLGIMKNEESVTRQIEGDFLRLCYTGDIEHLLEPAQTPDKNYLINQLSQRGDKKAVVVANGREAVLEAIEAGCDAIEQGYNMGQENLRRMAEKGILWIPNVIRAKNGLDSSGSGGDVCCRFSQRYVAPGKAAPGAEEFWKKTLAEQLEQLRFAKTVGVITATGTGAGCPGLLHGESMVEEMKLFINKAGYSLEETIRCASENGARFFGMENLGALEVGRSATFLVSRGTVKQLPRKLNYLENIYFNGRPSSAYNKVPEIVGSF